ncbi:hypothetical protein Fcan01_15823 [Folsomia candida]|uniref:Uncharacterized protein n=1 Tax=Folsomia candida TaxID=158441 RepID=A0A226DWP3_FOLCA|nr:hypothetical protein Fcan01_15823 [Folsomia candida]
MLLFAHSTTLPPSRKPFMQNWEINLRQSIPFRLKTDQMQLTWESQKFELISPHVVKNPKKGNQKQWRSTNGKHPTKASPNWAEGDFICAFDQSCITSGTPSKCYRLLSAFPISFGEEHLPEFLVALLYLAADFTLNSISNPNRLHFFRQLNLFNSKHGFHPIGFSYLRENNSYSVLRGDIERDFLRCGKTVLISKSTQLESEYEYLSRNYPNTKLFKSSQGVQGYSGGLSFHHPWKSVVVKRFKTTVEAGVWGYVEREEKRRINYNRIPVMKHAKDDKPTNIATLGGAFLTVFILAGSLACVTILVFIIECRSRITLLTTNIRRAYTLRRYRKLKKLAAMAVILAAVGVCEKGKNN